MDTTPSDMEGLVRYAVTQGGLAIVALVIYWWSQSSMRHMIKREEQRSDEQRQRDAERLAAIEADRGVLLNVVRDVSQQMAMSVAVAQAQREASAANSALLMSLKESTDRMSAALAVRGARG